MGDVRPAPDDRNLRTSTELAVGPDEPIRSGAHLSFAGLLTSLFVPFRTGPDPSARTTPGSWESERTVWLRTAFSGSTTLPDLAEAPDPRWVTPGGATPDG